MNEYPHQAVRCNTRQDTGRAEGRAGYEENRNEVVLLVDRVQRVVALRMWKNRCA